jgi:formylglycine-generating enzyme required for sulfatase activity
MLKHATLVLALLAGLAAQVHAVTIDTVLVGNPGNGNDPLTGNLYGGVNYAYRIGTTEVTNAQYAEFLNAKGASDPLFLYNPSMNSDVHGGITRSGVDGSYTYTTKPDMANKPVNWVSWYDSIRFSNWLNNGQGNGDTEADAYTIGALGAGGIPINSAGIIRNAGATWFLPSENEWYKAAYFQPAAEGGDADSYWLYPTASNTVPTIATANSVGDISNPGVDVVNYQLGAQWNGQIGTVTTVGSAGPLSQSFYGTADQGGNVFEWTEGRIRTSAISRGGTFDYFAIGIQSTNRAVSNPSFEIFWSGFRVAAVPEPSSFVLAALSVVGLVVWRRRKR